MATVKLEIAATNMTELKAQLATCVARAMNGAMDEKTGRMISNFSARIVEAQQSETRARIVSMQLKERVVPMGEAKL